MFPPAPCANRNTGGSAPRVAESNLAVTPCLPTATLHVLLRIGESLSLAELAIRAHVADRFLLEPRRLAEQREVVVRFGQVGCLTGTARSATAKALLACSCVIQTNSRAFRQTLFQSALRRRLRRAAHKDHLSLIRERRTMSP